MQKTAVGALVYHGGLAQSQTDVNLAQGGRHSLLVVPCSLHKDSRAQYRVRLLHSCRSNKDLGYSAVPESKNELYM